MHGRGPRARLHDDDIRWRIPSRGQDGLVAPRRTGSLDSAGQAMHPGRKYADTIVNILTKLTPPAAGENRRTARSTRWR